MKKKFAPIVLSALMVASLVTACGGKSETPASTPAAETKTEAAPAAETASEEEAAPEVEEEVEVEVEEETEDDAEVADEGDAEGFTLLDVSSDMIDAGIYAVSEDGTEIVFSMFTEPSGTPMASLFVFASDGSGGVICGPYTGESETDEEGITWSLMTVSDVYSGNDLVIGFGEAGDQVYILDEETAYEGEYLSADETIDYMGVAAALLE